MLIRFRSKVWRYQGEGSWFFATLPTNISKDIKDIAPYPKRGFGAIKVVARCGVAEWETSIFPSNEHNAYLLPIKIQIRRTENIEEDATYNFELILDR